MIYRRILSGVVMVGALVLAAFCAPAALVWLLIVAAAGVATLEFYAMLAVADLPAFRYFGVACGALLISATFFSFMPGGGAGLGSEAEGWALLIIVLSMLARQFPQKHNVRPIPTMACTFLGVFYVAFLFNYFTRLAVAFEPVPLGSPLGVTGRRLIFYLVAVVKSMDTGAFLFGSVFGRHKLFPRISPNKTWEGFVGGIAAGLGASLLFFHACRSGPGAESAALGTVVFGLRDAVMLGVLLPAAGVLGDLLESLIKRGCGVKDSGRWIPGMGGMLDITDSLLVAAPVLYYYVRFVLK